MNPRPHSLPRALCLIGILAVLSVGCALRSMNTLQKSTAAPADAIQFYGPSWDDASGKDGKGGVSIVCLGDTHNFLLRPDPSKKKIDAQTLSEHPDWVLFDSEANADDCLSYEFTWVTSPTDKFWGKKWAGGGVAFNKNWSAVDLTGAKYLSFYAKTNNPGVDFNLGLTGTTDSATTGNVKLSDFATGHKLGTDWTQVIIPLSSIPSLSKLDITQCKIVRFDLAGDYPENTPVYIHLDKLYFTDAKMVTPVSNLGWQSVPGGVYVVWDKSAEEEVTGFQLTVDGQNAGEVDGKQRSAKLPLSFFKAAGTHLVGVSAMDGTQSSAVQTASVDLTPRAVGKAVVTVSSRADHPISPYLYGFNYLASDSLKKVGGTVNRWGGNDTTNYNWKDDADNKGNDWYFLNAGGPPKSGLEKDKRYYQFIEDCFNAGSQAIITIPTIGWVAKPAPTSGKELCSYPTSVYPDQEASDGQGAGNGVLANKKGMIWDIDPNLNYIPSTPAFQKEWVQTIVKNFKPASQGGVRFYQMDNEPGLWQFNHRDVCPKGIGYKDLVELNASYATAVKEVDPEAQVIGFTAWGVMELAGSPWDYIPGGVANYRDRDNAKGDKWTERKAHGDFTQLAYYLYAMNKLSQKAGKRLIDYVDDHGFPEVWAKNAKGDNVNVLGDFPYDPVLTPKQFDALRIFYDPTFEDPESWCAQPGNKEYLFDPWRPLIPNLKKMIDKYYPGTKLSMTEYYPASQHYYHGGLLQVVTMGIYMREGLDMACDWGSAWEGGYVYLGHQLFSNYDGKGSQVGGDYVPCDSSDPDLYSFGARNGAKHFVILVNRNHDKDFETTVNLPQAATSYQIYTMSESLGYRLLDSGRHPAPGASLPIHVPAFSAILVVAQAPQVAPAASPAASPAPKAKKKRKG